jgi:hypothetical protein
VDTNLTKACLWPALTNKTFDRDPSSDAQKNAVVVQFNPETLKVAYSNEVQKPDSGADKRGTQLFVGEGTTKLTCTLWFDVNAPQPPQPDATFKSVDDVRKLTARVAYFITPKADKQDPKKFIPPPVRFEWGSFVFAGIMDSIEESLELWSPEGKPLRASVGISMTQQKILILPFGKTDPANRPPAGTRPTTPVPQGSSVQQMAGENWQGVAQANNVENPRLVSVGLRLDLNLGVS